MKLRPSFLGITEIRMAYNFLSTGPLAAFFSKFYPTLLSGMPCFDLSMPEPLPVSNQLLSGPGHSPYRPPTNPLEKHSAAAQGGGARQCRRFPAHCLLRRHGLHHPGTASPSLLTQSDLYASAILLGGAERANPWCHMLL